MSARIKVMLGILVAAFIIAASASVVLLEKNAELEDDKKESSTQLCMTSTLMRGQIAVENELEKVRAYMIALAFELGETGLNGTLANAALNGSLASNPYAIDILTFNTTGIVQAIEPETYGYMEGVDLSDGKTNELIEHKILTMSSTFQARGIDRGLGYACPVYDTDGKFLGAVSALVDMEALMNATLPSLIEGTSFTWFCMQWDGTEIYDTDESQIGLNAMTDPIYANWTAWLEVGARALNETSGYGTYSFTTEVGLGDVIEKECFWTSVGAETTDFRLFIVHQTS